MNSCNVSDTFHLMNMVFLVVVVFSLGGFEKPEFITNELKYVWFKSKMIKASYEFGFLSTTSLFW